MFGFERGDQDLQPVVIFGSILFAFLAITIALVIFKRRSKRVGVTESGVAPLFANQVRLVGPQADETDHLPVMLSVVRRGHNRRAVEMSAGTGQDDVVVPRSAKGMQTEIRLAPVNAILGFGIA